MSELYDFRLLISGIPSDTTPSVITFAVLVRIVLL